MTYQVGYFVGSLSSSSINRVLSRALLRLAPADLQFNEIAIGTWRNTLLNISSDFLSRSEALLCSVMSRKICDIPTISPVASRIGDTVKETSIVFRSLVIRAVS